MNKLKTNIMKPHCSDYQKKNNGAKGLVFGLLVIAAGVLLLLRNMGLLSAEMKNIFFSWQMLLIAIGLINIAGRTSRLIGVVLIAIGTFFLIPDFFVFDIKFRTVFFPLLLIIIGIVILIQKFIVIRHNFADEQCADNAKYVDETNIFSGTKNRFALKEFRGGKITSIFGGAEIDFSDTQLAPGKHVLVMTCIFGGASLIIPSDWKVNTEIVSILGGFVDKRVNMPKEIPDDAPELVIKGLAIFGGGEIKSFAE